MLVGLLLTIAAYWSGLSGAFLFDDYPNIVNNQALHLKDLDVPGLSRAALSSPSSELKRPLASLSFAFNHLATGLDPFWMKATNLIIHLLNGLLVYGLAKRLLRLADGGDTPRLGGVAAAIASGWLLLPINLSAVLYVVQRMEGLANLFVLFGLWLYVKSRQRMQSRGTGVWLCIASLAIPTALGVLAKESAVMLPLYAFCVEWLLFGFLTSRADRRDVRILATFALLLAVPLVAGLLWLLPSVLNPENWAARDFTLGTRLLSETRIVTGYIPWTLFPTPSSLSFYHDQVEVSAGLFSPWTTFASIIFLVALAVIVWTMRKRAPLVSLGLTFFLGGHLLTGTILPLDLVYEHRNYFASFGLLLTIVPFLAVDSARSFARFRWMLLGLLLAGWFSLTTFTAYAWGDPLRLARDLATRNPNSPRAQYELGFTYVVYSHYLPSSPFVSLAYEQLELAASLPRSPILAEQALIMMSARMGSPQNEEWWNNLIIKMARRKASADDISALAALATCQANGDCDYQGRTLVPAFLAGLAHANPEPRLMATYAEYAWNVLRDPDLALRMAREAARASPTEPAYQVTLVRILTALGNKEEAERALGGLRALNHGGQLDDEIEKLTRVLAEPAH
ncbi:hypothetical protein H0E84_18385 [Luteimonas sp. SJ-92]|uniref:Tetratricopeptide repeat protein n=2 Tax=Luteimonas salinisoli TaxID=2752307 RepID=A0A853JIS6_9GAMM|nr:hypothetical protein [Luteimonas salinisoli]